MIPYYLKRFLLSPTELHVICALVALLCCIPAIFPEVCPEEAGGLILLYAGGGFMTALIGSFAFMVLAGLIHLVRLNNVKAFGQLLKWSAVWGAGFGLFVLIALAADVGSPDDEGDAHPIQVTDTLFHARDSLTGPEALTIPLETEHQGSEYVAHVPHLNKLENEHPELLRDYLERSPRWQAKLNDDTFYSKPGHLVMVPPTVSGPPGMVHVSFRYLTEGAPLPEGFTVLHPGDAFPTEVNDAHHRQTDFAIDLGRNHYLLLAWRGTAHAETAHKALNAAISAIDERMQPLSENPTAATVEHMLRGRESYTGSTPEIRLAELPGQDGAYQAEVYANPGEAGTLLFFVRRMEDDQALRLFHCPAKFSADKGELFRHNFPCDVPEWQRESYSTRIGGILPKDSPVFIVGTGDEHRYFGAALEVWFKPADSHRPRTLLLRRCYRMQFCDTDTAERSENAHAPVNVHADEKSTAPTTENDLPENESSSEAPARADDVSIDAEAR